MRDLGLSMETRDTLGSDEARVQNLERHVSPELLIERSENSAEAAATQQAFDSEPSAYNGPDIDRKAADQHSARVYAPGKRSFSLPTSGRPRPECRGQTPSHQVGG
jgi:hypothetical protein